MVFGENVLVYMLVFVLLVVGLGGGFGFFVDVRRWGYISVCLMGFVLFLKKVINWIVWVCSFMGVLERMVVGRIFLVLFWICFGMGVKVLFYMLVGCY